MSFFDYEHLRVIWWLLLGVLLTGFAVMDGFDLGVGMLLPFVGRSDAERRVVINTIGPVWEGNQVWLILGAGAIFAAWPLIYAIAFSGFYLAMFLILSALILRPVGFKYRSKLPSPTWRTTWDWLLFVGGFVPALVFGVAMGNALEGAPFKFDDTMRMSYEGGFFDLLNPYALTCGLVSVAMVVLHGGAYLALKTDGPVAARSRLIGSLAGMMLIILFALAGDWTANNPGYRIVGAFPHDAASNPLAKTVVLQTGAWLLNYRAMPATLGAPLLGFAGAALGAAALAVGRPILGFIGSTSAVIGVVATAGASMFPFILPSSLDPDSSLTVWDASSSKTTLLIMLVAAAIFVPIIIAYTSFLYHVMWGKVTTKTVDADHMSY